MTQNSIIFKIIVDLGVKARSETAGANGHAHINIASFLLHCTTIITIFALL